MISETDISGMKFGRFTAIEITRISTRNIPMWRCVCECGEEREVRIYSLLNGASKSCGCLHKELAAAHATKHGAVESKEYNSWRGAKERCTNPKHIEYPIYGGRGITMAPEWLSSFSQFFKDMGKKPSDSHSLDRKNNEGPYSKDNCKWSTKEEQMLNRRVTLMGECYGMEMRLLDISAVTGVPYTTIRKRKLDGRPLFS